MSRPTFGIEEEYLLVDRASGQLVTDLCAESIQHCHDLVGPGFSQELIRGQIEVSSPIFTRRGEADEFFQHMRRKLSEGLAEDGLALYCASSHPTAHWASQQIVDMPDYQALLEDYQRVARRCLLAGLHIHVSVTDADRMQVIQRLLPWLPLFLALTTSSPFWAGEPTGYLSYRRVALKEWLRADEPGHLPNSQHYQRYRAFHQRWNLPGGITRQWPVRPSERFPTVELRICDACPRLEDALCIASLFQHLVHHCTRLCSATQHPAEQRWATEENFWRAARYGRHGRFIVPPAQIELDANAWLQSMQREFPPSDDDSELAFADAHRILSKGTSADQQLAVYEKGLRRGLTTLGALNLSTLQVLAQTALDPS